MNHRFITCLVMLLTTYSASNVFGEQPTADVKSVLAMPLAGKHPHLSMLDIEYLDHCAARYVSWMKDHNYV